MGQVRVRRSVSKETALALKVRRIEIELATTQKELSNLQTQLTATKAQVLADDEDLLGGVILLNERVLKESVSLPENTSGYAVGPLKVPLGMRLRVSDGARLIIL